MSYFVTGATGFIGRHLVERLLERDGEIHVLVREGSEDKMAALHRRRWGGDPRIHAVTGDLSQPGLGVDPAWVEAHRGQVDHLFHLAAIYDMTAGDDVNERLNVTGTRNAVSLANALDAGCLHHTSSIAVAGLHEGVFTEEMFDEGQKLPSPYHRTKFESERIVREEAQVPWRVYRPAVVVGHSETGEMDKVDGPYYFFKAIQRLRRWVPEWVPLVGPDLGWTNLVPVDYVARAMDHLAHAPDLDGRAFHLSSPKAQRSGDVLNAFARAAHAPQMSLRVDTKLLDLLPKGVISTMLEVPPLREVRRAVLGDFGIPEEVVEHVGFSARFETRDTQRALAGSGIEVPDLDRYADRLWKYWERHLDPDRLSDKSLGATINGRTVIITGASSGIGRAAAVKVADAGGIPLLVARGEEKLEEVRAEIEAAGGSAYVYPADLTDMDALEDLVARIMDDHPAVDMLVNNAGRSIRRSVALSQDRFHDFERTMQLNYFSAIKLITLLLPHMKEQRSGHVVNVSSIGVQTNPPRFSAYVASKAALDAWTRVVATEVLGDGISFTTIHMPLVRTPMIAPTKIYDSFPTITPDEAADMVCEALRSRPKQINTRLGTFGEIAYALAPKAVDQILHMAYKVFPDSAAAKGEKDPAERASMEQVAMAKLLRGVHW